MLVRFAGPLVLLLPVRQLEATIFLGHGSPSMFEAVDRQGTPESYCAAGIRSLETKNLPGSPYVYHVVGVGGCRGHGPGAGRPLLECFRSASRAYRESS